MERLIHTFFIFAFTAMAVGCEIGGSVSNDDSDPMSTDSISTDDTASDSDSAVAYNGIPGAEPGTCGFAYVPIQLLATVDEGSGQAGVRFSYDTLGNLREVSSDVPFANRSMYEYDGYLLTRMTFERLNATGEADERITSTIEYDAQSLPVQMTSTQELPVDTDGTLTVTRTTFAYTNNKLAEAATFNCASAAECTELVTTKTYTYNASGRLVTIAHDMETITFVYDAENQIAQIETRDSTDTVTVNTLYTYENDRLATKTRNGYVRTYFYEDERLVRSQFADEIPSTTVFTLSDQTDACALLRAWPLFTAGLYENTTSRLLMLDHYGSPAPTQVFF